MKIIGLGTDIVEVRRIKKFASKKGALERIFSDEEISYCLSRKNSYEHLAVRFAAKEAVYKALPFDEIAFRAISIVNLENGSPRVIVDDPRAKDLDILITLSHTEQYATATVVIQK